MLPILARPGSLILLPGHRTIHAGRTIHGRSPGTAVWLLWESWAIHSVGRSGIGNPDCMRECLTSLGGTQRLPRNFRQGKGGLRDTNPPSPGGVARVSLRAVSRSRSTAEAGGPEGKSSLPNGIRARRARLGGPLTKEVTAASRTKLSDGHEAPGTQRPPPPLRERITTSKPLKNSSLTKYGCRRRPD